PILCEGVPLAPEVVFGVYAFPAGEAAPRDVLRRLFNAAADARGSAAPVAAYDESQDLAHQRRFRLLNDIREALAGSDQ
ncbi:hypothetical protein NL364_31425, partial [Klebsiella pneumoniae]|nr:hypothetical protein [Klebsiella pneumoniae]